MFSKANIQNLTYISHFNILLYRKRVANVGSDIIIPFYYRKEANSSSFVFFNGADISICLMLWVASALLLIGIYLRFVSGKR